MDLLKSRARPWPYPPVDLWDLLHSPHPTSFKLLPYSPNSSYQLLLPLSFNSSSFNLSYFLLSPIPSKHLLLTLSTSSYLLPKGLRWLVSGIDFMHEEISRLFCSEKFCGGGGGWRHAIIATSSRSRSLWNLRLRLLEFTWRWPGPELDNLLVNTEFS